MNSTDLKGLSSLERRFIMLWMELEGSILIPQYKFHSERRWRMDFARPFPQDCITLLKINLLAGVGIELEGGLWAKGGGGHNRGSAYERDGEKFLEATLRGWIVFRLNPKQITTPIIREIIQFIQMREPASNEPSSNYIKAPRHLS
jgi:hypothetical protein